jgi:hypothetical protein
MRVNAYRSILRAPLQDVVDAVFQIKDMERLKEIAERDRRLLVRNAAKRRLGVLLRREKETR